MAAQLPSVPRRLVLTEAPKSTVSAADIAAPLTGLGEGLARIGQGVEDVAAPFVEEEARKQVTVGPDGTPQVTTLPHLMGRLGKMFNTTAVNTYEHRLDAEVRDAISKKQIEFENQPDKFKAWWEPYKAQLLANAPAAQRPILESKLMRFGTEGGQHIAVQRQNTDDNLRLQGRKIEMDRLDEDLALIARQNGTGTDGFRARQEQRNKLIDQWVADPRSPISKEAAQQFKDASIAKAYGQSVLSRVEQGISESGYQAGRAALDAGIAELMKGVLGGDPNNPDASSHYGLKVRDINKIKTEGEKLLKQSHGEMAGERQAQTAQWADMKNKNNSALIPDADLKRFEEEARRTGNWRVMQDIEVTRRSNAFAAANANRPLSEKIEVGRTGVAPQTWEQPGTGGKLVPDSWTRGLIRGESAGNPYAPSKTSSAGGLLQFTDDTWLDTAWKHRRDLFQGQDRYNKQAMARVLALKMPNPAAGWSEEKSNAFHMEMGGYLSNDNGQYLKDRNIPLTPSTIKAAHFLGADGAAKLYSVPAHTPIGAVATPKQIGANKEVFAANPTAGQLISWIDKQMQGGAAGGGGMRSGPGTFGPGAPASMTGGGAGGGGRKLWETPEGAEYWKRIRNELRENLSTSFKQFEVAEGKLQFPTKDEVAAMVQTAGAIGNDADIKKAAQLEAAAQFGEGFMKLGDAEREQVINQFANAIANGDTDPYKRDIFKRAEKAHADIKKAYQENPQLADALISGGRAPETLQWGNHNQVAAEIEQRKTRSSAIQAGEGIPQFNLMQPGERQSFAKYMQQADAQGVAKTFEALGQQTDDQLKVMIHDETIKSTIKGLMYSTDYQKNKAAMMGVDALYTRLPVETTQQLGVDSIKRLSNWRTVSRFEDPEAGQKRLNRLAQEDPAATERRLEIEKKALSDASDVQPQKIVNEFAWAPWSVPVLSGPSNWAVGMGQWALGLAPQRPPDTGTTTALMVDYSKMYADALVANNGDKAAAHTSAIDILKKGGIWSVSPVNNRQLMRHAPEVVFEAYPSGITDSGHNWINVQLEQDVEKVLKQQYPELGDVGRYGPDKAAGPRYTTNLIADKRTEAEAAAYNKKEPAKYKKINPEDPNEKLNIPPSYALVVNDMRFAGPNGRVDALVGKRFHPEPNGPMEAYLAEGRSPYHTSAEAVPSQTGPAKFWTQGMPNSRVAPPEGSPAPAPGTPAAPPDPAAAAAAAAPPALQDVAIARDATQAAARGVPRPGGAAALGEMVGGAVSAGTETLRGVAAERDVAEAERGHPRPGGAAALGRMAQGAVDAGAGAVAAGTEALRGVAGERDLQAWGLDKAPGLVERGNINLFDRPRVKVGDDTATVASASFEIDGVEVLLPTVSDDGRIMTEDEAIAQYKKTGKHLGKFESPEAANAYAEKLHQQQEAFIAGRGGQPPDRGREVLAEKVRTGLAAVTEPLDIIQHKLQDAAMRRDGTLKPDQGREIVAEAVERGLAAVREPIAELQDSIQQGIQPTRDMVMGAVTRGQQALTAMQDQLRAMAEAKGKNVEYDGGRAALKANVEKAIDAGQKALKAMADSLKENVQARAAGAPMKKPKR